MLIECCGESKTIDSFLDSFARFAFHNDFFFLVPPLISIAAFSPKVEVLKQLQRKPEHQGLKLQ
jgi:hypothetical protein